MALTSWRNIICLTQIAVCLMACSNLGDQCLVKGEFTKLKDAELYFYTPEGLRTKIDTVTVREGKFTYSLPLTQEDYVVMTFTNMSQQVLFLAPGLEVSIAADASHLRDMEIKGGESNKLMTRFRQEVADLSASETTRKALEYIQAQPASLVSAYLFRRYVMQSAELTNDQALQAAQLLVDAQPSYVYAQQALLRLKARKAVEVGQKAPDFKVSDRNYKPYQLSDYQGKRLLLTVGANWKENCREELRRMRDEMKQIPAEKRPEVLNVVIDPSKPMFYMIANDSLPGVTAFEPRSFLSQILQDYQVNQIPYYILVDEKHKIVARTSSWDVMRAKLE